MEPPHACSIQTQNAAKRRAVAPNGSVTLAQGTVHRRYL
jgi:hypothetical protein